MFLFTLLVAVLILTALISAGVLYLLFCQSPEKRWKDHILGLRATAQKRQKSENVHLRQMADELEHEEKALSDKAFRSMLEKLSVEKLEAYAGIGTGTTSKLRQSGYTTLAALQRAHIQIHGLGEKRLGDIRDAVDKLTRQTWNRFHDKPHCPERAELDRRIQSLRRELERGQLLSRARSQGIEAFLRTLQGMVEIAGEVTFTGYLGLTKKTVVEPKYLEAQLPDLEEHVRAAEAKAARVWSEGERKALEVELAIAVPAAIADSPARRETAPGRASLLQETRTNSAHSNSPPTTLPTTARHSQPSVVQLRVSAPASAAPPKAPEKQHLDVMELTIQFAFAAARTDGRLAQAEKAVIEQHIEKRYWYDQALYNRARALCAHYESAPIDVGDCLRRVKEQFATAQRAALLTLAVEIIAASGGIKAREQEFLDKVSHVLEIALPAPAQHPKPSTLSRKAEMPFAALKTPEPVTWLEALPAVKKAEPANKVEPVRTPVKTLEPASALGDPRTLLEIDSATALSVELVRRHFNRLWERLDPEKMAVVGSDFAAMAESKRAAIRAAALTLITPFGEELEPKAVPSPPRDIRENLDLDQVFGV